MALLLQVAHPLDVASGLLPVNVGQDVQRLEDPAEMGTYDLAGSSRSLIERNAPVAA